MFITSAKEVEFYNKTEEEIKYPEGTSPAELYVEGNLEIRTDVILNHPDVIGFVFLYEDVVTKAFLPTKVVNFKARNENKKSLQQSVVLSKVTLLFRFPIELYLVMFITLVI